MIIQADNITDYESVDLSRPDLYTEQDHMRWGELHAWIKECDMPIVVNSAFWFVDTCLQDGQGYGGGGMKYMFWFNNTDDKIKFILKYDEIFD